MLKNFVIAGLSVASFTLNAQSPPEMRMAIRSEARDLLGSTPKCSLEIPQRRVLLNSLIRSGSNHDSGALTSR